MSLVALELDAPPLAPAARDLARALPPLEPERDGARRLAAASARLAATLGRWGRLADEPGLACLFTHFCVLAALDGAPHRIAGAMPSGDGAFDGDAMLGTLARLGIRARRVSVGAPFVAGELPRLFVGRDGTARLLFRDPDTFAPVALDGEGGLEAISPRSPLGAGRCWGFAPEAGADPLSKAQRAHSGQTWLRTLLGKFHSVALCLGLVVLAGAAASVALPLFTIQIYANVISLGSLEPLGWLVGGMAMLVALEALLLEQRARVLAWIANRLEYLVSSTSFERILKVRPAISERVAVTDQAARLRTFENIREFITGPAFATLLEAPVSLLALLAIGLIGGWLVVVPVLGMAAHLCLFLSLRRRARISTSIAADASTEMQRVTIETFEKRDAIRQAGLQDIWAARMTRTIREAQAAQMRLRLVGALGESVSTFILTVSAIFLLAAGAHGIWAGTLGAGGLLASIILGLRVLGPTHMMCLSVQRFEQVTSSIRQLDALMEIPLESEERETSSRLRPLEGAISFLNAGMRSGDTRPLFVGLNLDIRPGEVVAVTGGNGTGKTTILKLVQGLSDLAMGAIRIDGADMRQLPLEELRRRIGYVPQEPRLFPGTLRENLLFADPFADEARLAAVLAETGLAAAVAALPGGLDHRLDGAEDEFLSLDFRFRFAIAQAVLGESRVLLVDEIPNSLMNGEVGALFRRLVASNNRRRTILFVSHRSDDLDLADRIVTLRYGNVPTLTTPAPTPKSLP